ncbi:hypothetical protein SAMN06297397_0281 [Aristaeella lactis]|uniref:Uncharacterized protein n=1 Tax=Aristaeella lactis TaxID=3046383 RepID=A0AC61PHP9_9FIRM|nr:hypothetical protein SAMN06297397_0281 [Aristaeella lactis]
MTTSFFEFNNRLRTGKGINAFNDMLPGQHDIFAFGKYDILACGQYDMSDCVGRDSY